MSHATSEYEAPENEIPVAQDLVDYFADEDSPCYDGSVVAEVKAACSQKLKANGQSYKIAVMGCIVNGPGEMADADYGYVGAGRNCISLYRGKECVLKNIPQEQAVEQLLALIEADKNNN